MNENNSTDGRELGVFEELLWLIDQTRPNHFALTAIVSGEIVIADWRKAIDIVQRHHPPLSVCIEAAPNQIPRFKKIDVQIPLRVLVGNPLVDWVTVMETELAQTFDATRAPLLRTALVHDGKTAALILTAHHAIADGLSLIQVISDILSSLAGDELKVSSTSRPQDAVLQLNRPTARNVIDSAPERFAQSFKPRVRGRCVHAEVVAKLKSRARKEQTTLNGALCAALAIAGRQVAKDWRGITLRIGCPVSTRTILGVDGCGVYFVGAKLAVEPTENVFWEIARLAKRGIHAVKTRESLTAMMSGLNQFVGSGIDISTAWEFASTAFVHEAMLSNLGELPLKPAYGPLRLEEIWGPSVLLGFEGEQTVGAATFNGSLFLTHTSLTPHEGLLDAIERVLAHECGN